MASLSANVDIGLVNSVDSLSALAGPSQGQLLRFVEGPSIAALFDARRADPAELYQQLSQGPELKRNELSLSLPKDVVMADNPSLYAKNGIVRFSRTETRASVRTPSLAPSL